MTVRGTFDPSLVDLNVGKEILFVAYELYYTLVNAPFFDPQVEVEVSFADGERIIDYKVSVSLQPKKSSRVKIFQFENDRYQVITGLGPGLGYEIGDGEWQTHNNQDLLTDYDFQMKLMFSWIHEWFAEKRDLKEEETISSPPGSLGY